MSKKFSMNDLLNNQSKAPSSGTGSGFVVRDIPIGKIIPSPENKYGIRDIEELAANIEGMGLMHNLVVKAPDGEGNYELISGERRFRACKLLFDSGNEAFSTVPCKVEAQSSAAEAELKLLYTNATQRVLTDYEKTMQAARIKELLQAMKADGYKFKGRMREIVAEILNVSSAQMGRMESISKNLSPGFAEEFKAGNIGITAAYELSTMQPDAQAAALEQYRETGMIDTPPKVSSPPPAPPAAAGAVQPPAKDKERDDAEPPPAPPSSPPAQKHVERDAPQKAFVCLTDKDGVKVEYSGNLAVIAAVDTETDKFAGVFSDGDGVTGLDYATLAAAVCKECLSRIEGDEISIDIMRVNLAALFTNGFET